MVGVGDGVGGDGVGDGVGGDGVGVGGVGVAVGAAVGSGRGLAVGFGAAVTNAGAAVGRGAAGPAGSGDSVAVALGSTDGDSRSEALVRGLGSTRGLADSDGTPAKTPPPGVAGCAPPLAARLPASQLEPTATVPALSASVAPMTA